MQLGERVTVITPCKLASQLSPSFRAAFPPCFCCWCAVLALLVLACADSALAWADSDASMILHRNVYAVRDGVVVDVWEMDGSIGRTQ